MKSILNHRNLFVVLMCAAVLVMMGTVFAEEIFPDVNYPAIEEANHTMGPEYVENEIIVKFRGNSAVAIETGVAKGIAAHELKLSDSLDKLNKRYKLKKAKPLFKNFKENRQRVKALLSKDKALLSKKERHILRRLKRAPKDAKVPDLSRIYKMELELEPGQSLQEVVEAYRSNPDVEYAELNYFVYIARTPNDPWYSGQWGLEKIDAPEAWDISTGSSDIIVAVIDSGVDYTHPDIDDNIWVNNGEIGGNGVDDDRNGYIDDVYGYDFRNNDSDPQDDHGHGTHIAGIVAAEGDNGLDIAGVCWDARIMALKFLGADNWGTWADAVKAIYYAVENGADITSNSYGGGYSKTLKEAVDYAHSQGVINVAAAMNERCNCPFYPANYEHMIAVAATNSDDQKAGFSNYGNWVDIAAPGSYILSLRRGGGTRYMSGTSMACPHISGACALLLSFNPTLTADEVYDILMETVDVIFAPGICRSNGRLNLFKAIQGAVLPKGHISLDADSYSCAGVVTILLTDRDLAGQGSQEVTLTTDGGDWETVVLAEKTPAIGIFTGTISAGSGSVNIEDGVLQLADGEIITATYEDANDGTGNPAIANDTAVADCEGPLIFNVQIDAAGREPIVSFETDEATTARVLCGLACGDYIIEGEDLRLATSHSVKLTGVSAATDYFFIVEATDAVGNESVDDNAGDCYSFTTTAVADIYVPEQFPTIQEAIDQCWDGGKVIVADGTYTGDGNRDLDFRGKAITVRSESGSEHCIIDCQGTEKEYHRGFYFHSGEDGNSVLDGFTIKNGNAHDGGAIYCYISSPTIINCNIKTNSSGWYGGGVSCELSSPTLTNCTFSGNVAKESGGGMFNSSSSPTVTNCTFSGNSANAGGGMYNEFGSPTVTNCTFSGNSASNFGGGMVNDGSFPTVTNCTFSGNSANTGGGMVNGWSSNPTVTNCTFRENSANYAGGGMHNYSSSPTLTNCTISGNSADESGGGMRNYRSSPTVSNCTFSGNTAEYSGGGMHNSSSYPMVTNCTFSGNSADEYGGGLSGGGGYYGDYGSITNCIIWNNVAHTGAQLYNTANPTYSCIQNWSSGGEGNIDADPCFVGLKIEEAPEGAIAHWNFDEGSGTIAYDSAGNNHGTVYGAQWTTGQIGGALSFDGVDDYVEVAGLTNPINMTYALWVKADSLPGSYNILLGFGGSAHSFGIRDSGKILFHIPFLGQVSSSSSITIGQWHHIAVTSDGSQSIIYIDGQADATGLANTKTGTGLGIGYHQGARGTHFDGIIDEVMIFDRALSAEEIRQFYYQMDYHLQPGSPCIDAGDNTAVPADIIDLDGDGDVNEPIPWDLDGSCRFVDDPDTADTGNGTPPIVDMGAYELVPPPLEVPMKFTPQVLNPDSRGKWLKAHFVLPEGFVIEDVDADTPASLEPLGIESEYINVFINEDDLVELEIGFDRAAICGAGIDYGPAEVTVIGLLSNCQYFHGTDTIRIINNNLKYLAAFTSHWLQAGCGAPDWCSGTDVDHSSMVDFVDFAMFDGCCIEVVKK